MNKKRVQVVSSELAGSMYPGPNRHPVDPRSVSISITQTTIGRSVEASLSQSIIYKSNRVTLAIIALVIILQS